MVSMVATGLVSFASLLGKEKYTNTVVRGGIPIVVAMPEGVISRHCQIRSEHMEAHALVHTNEALHVGRYPKGIPHAGKGENSWDCGDDQIVGYGVDGHDVAKAAARGEIVMESRRKYDRRRMRR